MKKLQLISKYHRVVGFVLVVVVTFVGLGAAPQLAATSLNELRQRSAQLEAEIKANEEQAAHLHAHAETLQAEVDKINAEINQVTREIELTTNKINELTAELEITKQELERQKGLLKANMRALYKRGGASTVELLVASDSFSEFIDEQEYLERLKGSIQESAEKVLALKQDIEAKKNNQEQLKKQQEQQQNELADKKSQQQVLLNKTRGQEAQYQAIVERLKQQQRDAEAALAAALSSGSYKVAPVGPVSGGDVVGAVGNTGLSSGRHLHLEVRVGGGVRNPDPYIKYQPVVPTAVSQPYGNPDPIYQSGYHPGIDYLPGNGAIRAIDAGYLYRGCSDRLLGTRSNAYGYVGIVQHSAGHISIYAHMANGPSECNYNTYY